MKFPPKISLCNQFFKICTKNKETLDWQVSFYVELSSKTQFSNLYLSAHIYTDLQEQLNGLMKTLHSTQPHFIRCIIPNEFKQPGK